VSDAIDERSRRTGDSPDGFADGAETRDAGQAEAGPFEEFGPYRVYELLGQGGMATVHRAEKLGVGIRRPIALKRLLTNAEEEDELVKLFVDEARLASHLHHANVAQTYELGKVGDTFFIAMEYASGPTLSQIVRQCHKIGGEIPIPVAVNILSQVCDALDYAHNLCDQAGQPLRIIHRDVSPGNIIVTNTGVVKLIDFGIAKATISSVKTQVGFIKGKFGYIAPEYIIGRIDSRVDLFAVGVIAHELLTGRRLFEGKDDFETLSNIREMVIRPPSLWNRDVTPELDDVVMTALARNPAKRWQTAGDMQSALAAVARTLGVAAGAQPLVDWVDWAFHQAVVEPEPAALRDSGANDTEQVAVVPSRSMRRDSSLSIQLGISPADDLMPALSPSDSDQTMPVDRVRMSLRDSETPAPELSRALPSLAWGRARQISQSDDAATPPLMIVQPILRNQEAVPLPPVPAAPIARGPQGSPPPGPGKPVSRGHDAPLPGLARPISRSHDAPLPGLTRPISRSHAPPPRPPLHLEGGEGAPPLHLDDAGAALPRIDGAPYPPHPPPPPPPRLDGAIATPLPRHPDGAAESIGASSHGLDGISLQLGRLFAEPPAPAAPSLPRVTGAPAMPMPGLQATAKVKPRPSQVASMPAAPGNERSVLWLVLLIIALGVAAMAVAYYWPATL
jgi:serine/threonine-protein kinase